MIATTPRTMFAKIWDEHVVFAEAGKQTMLYIDLHLVHEVTSPQAFEGLRLAGRRVRRPDRTVATSDHNVPTTDRRLPIAGPVLEQKKHTPREKCPAVWIPVYRFAHPPQKVVPRFRPGHRGAS